MRNQLRLVLVSLALGGMAISVSGCSSNASVDEPTVSTMSSGGADTGGGNGSTSGGTSQLPPGTLTAAGWDDNLNFAWYQKDLASPPMVEGVPMVPRADRLLVEGFDSGGRPLAGAAVTVGHAGQTMLAAPLAADGRLWLFPEHDGFQHGDAIDVTATINGVSVTGSARAGDTTLKLVAQTVAGPPSAFDVAIVLDTTGSMGDEIRYLGTEIAGIASALAHDYPGTAQRWALVCYRDVGMGDEYSVRTFDFSDAVTLQKEIAAQDASGGGDYPESPELGLDAAAHLAWSSGSVARLVFHIADAPHHAGHEQALIAAVDGLRNVGARIYPVSASGADELLHFTMRTEAELTGGRFLWLTDDSGVGGMHLDTGLPCYWVTKLNREMVRMIEMELTGGEVPLATGDIVRSVGSPMNGQCRLADGSVVNAL